MASADRNLERTDADSRKVERLLCRKTGRRVDVEHPRCQAPDEPCKYRSECIIYAMEEDEMASAFKAARRATETNGHA